MESKLAESRSLRYKLPSLIVKSIQVKHMASLLSESEGENARLIELAQVLKEEIRSYRRSEERSKHIDNLEYVKNVILKVTFIR